MHKNRNCPRGPEIKLEREMLRKNIKNDREVNNIMYKIIICVLRLFFVHLRLKLSIALRNIYFNCLDIDKKTL